MRKDPLSLDRAAPPRSAPSASLAVSATFTENTLQAIVVAQQLARQSGSESVESAHLLLGAMHAQDDDGAVRALIQISGLKWDEVWLYAQSSLEKRRPLAPDYQSQLSESARRTLQVAAKEARRSNREKVDDVHLFVACFRPQKTPGIAEVLAPLGVSAGTLQLHLRQLARTQAALELARESPLAQLTTAGERALDEAHAAMRASFSGRVSTLHLLIGILENPDGEAVEALQTLMINVEELRQKARAALANDGEIAGTERRFTPAAKRALDRAKAAASEGRRTHIGNADLMMGLLPQPMLWIERAQFGAQPDDPAAKILADVDAELFRAIFNGQSAPNPAPVKAVAAPTAPTPVAGAVKAFAFWFAVEVMLCLMMNAAGGWQRMAIGNSATKGLMLLIVGLLFGSGLGTCAMLFLSKDAARKSAWQASFAGTLLGVLIGMAVVGAFR